MIALKYMCKMNKLKVQKKNDQDDLTTIYICSCGKGNITEARSTNSCLNILIDCENCRRHYTVRSD